MDSTQGIPGGICPHLGLADDPQTALSYPSLWNECQRARPVAAPNLEHQQSYCLKDSHTTCPVFMRKEGRAALPAEIRARLNGARRPRRWIVWIVLLMLILLFGIALGAFMISHGGIPYFFTPTPTIPVTTAGSSTPSWTPSPSATNTFLLPGVTIFPTETKISPTLTPSAVRVTPKGTSTSSGGNPVHPTNTPIPTDTPTPTYTYTPEPPTDIPTETPLPPTDTPEPPTETSTI